MAHVVIGASTGGLPAAYELRAILGKVHRITLIFNSDTFQFVPSNPRVAVGWRTREDTTFELAPYLCKKNINFIPVTAEVIKPDANQVLLADGQVIDYDYLVISPGPKLAFDKVEEGLGPHGHTLSVCTVESENSAAGEKAQTRDQLVQRHGSLTDKAVLDALHQTHGHRSRTA